MARPRPIVSAVLAFPYVAYLAHFASLAAFVPSTTLAQKPAFCAAYPAPSALGPGQWQASHAFFQDRKLVYPPDAEKNRIVDFSYAGYRYGGAVPPLVAEAARLGPAAGDNTARIQAALDQVGARPADANGFRGALVLEPGEYEISGTVRVNRSGVVLRGSGDGADPATSTILRAPGNTPSQRSVVVVGNGSGWNESGGRSDIVTPFVQVGSLTLEVANGTGFRPGEEVLIKHPSNAAWVAAVDHGGTNPDWRAGQNSMEWWRTVRAISGNTVTLDAPVYNHLDRSLTQSYLAKATWSPVVNAGVENLRINILPESGTSEDHAWNGVNVNGARDSWVRKVTALHFTYAGVKVENSARITVMECQALDPVGVRTGARFYNFAVNAKAQLILFTRCRLNQSRHGFVSNGTSTASGIVFHRSTTDGGADMEGHRHWTQAMLFDNITEQGSGFVKLINRGDWGTSHGWGSAHSVSWRFNKASYIQKPPTAQNWGVTDIGSFATNYAWPGPAGAVEKKEGTLVPESLYEAQLCERFDNGSLDGNLGVAVRPSIRPVVGLGNRPGVPAGSALFDLGGRRVAPDRHAVGLFLMRSGP